MGAVDVVGHDIERMVQGEDNIQGAGKHLFGKKNQRGRWAWCVVDVVVYRRTVQREDSISYDSSTDCTNSTNSSVVRSYMIG